MTDLLLVNTQMLPKYSAVEKFNVGNKSNFFITIGCLK